MLAVAWLFIVNPSILPVTDSAWGVNRFEACPCLSSEIAILIPVYPRRCHTSLLSSEFLRVMGAYLYYRGRINIARGIVYMHELMLKEYLHLPVAQSLRRLVILSTQKEHLFGVLFILIAILMITPRKPVVKRTF